MACRHLAVGGAFCLQRAEAWYSSHDPHAHRILERASDRAGPAARPADFTAATLRIAGGEVLIGATYLTHGLGISGPNVGRLASIVAFLAHITFPWCLLGDWNVEPHELRDAGFLDQLCGALIWTPSDTRSTCGLPPFPPSGLCGHFAFLPGPGTFHDRHTRSSLARTSGARDHSFT